jgi:hypothetical protein
MREQRVVLEHEADAALVGGQARHVLSAKHDAAGIGRLEARDHAQRRGLAASRRPEQRQELARRHVEGDVTRRVHLTLDAMRKALGYAVHAHTDGAGGMIHAPSNPASGVAPGARNRRSTRPIAPITTNTIATTSTEKAAAWPSASSVRLSRSAR